MNLSIASNSSIESASISTEVLVLTFLDFAARISFFLTHAGYFIIVLTYGELQKITLFPMHHVNIIGLFQSVLYTSWLGSITPALNSEYWNNVVCLISEFCSSVFKYARSYSIFILALYRLYAVLSFTKYKVFSTNIWYTLLSGLISWTIPIILFFSNKYATGSGPGYFCADGANNDITLNIIYNSVAWTIGFLIPMTSSIVLSIVLTKKIELQTGSIRKVGRTLNKQLIMLNTFETLNFFSLIVVYASFLAGQGGTVLQIILGIFHTLSLAILPVFTLIFVKIEYGWKKTTWYALWKKLFP